MRRRLTKEQDKAARHRRRTISNKMRAEIKGSHTEADLLEILKDQNYLCRYCTSDLREVEMHLDHIIPIVPRPGYPSGTDDKSNIQFLCKKCNQRKGNKDPEVFVREVSFNQSLHQSLLSRAR